MTRRALHALLAILLVGVVTAQARLDGVWQGETAGGRARTLTLAGKADTLTGRSDRAAAQHQEMTGEASTWVTHS